MRMTPFTARKMPAMIGLPKIPRNACSNSRPTIPTGMVARMIIQASLWSSVRTRRSRIEEQKPPMILIQSRQK